ncbi:MAG TPA: hypothetical protein VH541_05620 [Gaiellaceae bacterium]|jgi:hypothetical protein
MAAVDLLEQAEYELALRRLRKAKALEHPAFMLQFTHCVDAKTGEDFDFDLLTAGERETIDLDGEPGPWHWHRDLLDSWMTQTISLEYKARQLGITWLAAAYGLWIVLARPGSRVLIVSINQDEAVKVIGRIWGMYQALPSYMRDHMTLTKPARGGLPSQEIEFMDREGKRSAIIALPSTPKAGHGETAALVILDEFAYEDFARQTWKACFPIIDGGGRAIIVSTANGVSTVDGEGEAAGSFFHYLWANASSMGIARRFLGVFTHPDRDEDWYALKARSLPPSDRAESYPRTPEEGFILTGRCWFDLDVLNAYQDKWRESGRTGYRMSFRELFKEAARVVRRDGEWRVYEDPVDGHHYGIACDVATGSGDDFSSAHLIDLTNGRWVAEYHARVHEDVFAKDLYYMGRWYFDAIIAVETQGGYGRAVVMELRNPRQGRRPYSKLYRHHVGVEETIDPAERDAFGYPVNQATRPQLINQLEQWIRDGLCPWITPDLDGELRTFSRRNTRPSPRALEGCNDDRVMSAAGSLELYRQYGSHPKRRKQKTSRGRWKNSQYSWERDGAEREFNLARYPANG